MNVGQDMAGIKDVAKEAGVSIATVSYVLNGTRTISPETVKLVKAAAKKLNYTPNYSARMLRTRKSHAIAFITHRLTNDFFPDVIEAVENVLYQRGYSLLLGLSQNSAPDEIKEFRNMIERQVSGIIIAPTQMNFDYRSLCPDERFPLVFVDRVPVNQTADSVQCDNYYTTYGAICELIRRGHRHIAFVNTKYDQDRHEWRLSTHSDRLHAYQKALEDNGLSDCACIIEEGVTTRADGYRIMSDILSLGSITATFVCNSVMAQGALRCLQERGVSIPGQMALISFDAYNWSQLVSPPLSAIEQPTAELGRIAAETILNRIEHPELPHRRVVLDSKLVLRGSC